VDQFQSGGWISFRAALPGFDHLPDDELSALIRERVEAREKQLREDARANGDTFLGRRAVRRQSRQSYPRSYEHRFRTVPTVACKSKWARIERLARKRDWQQDYAAARDAFCAGNRTVRFP
jgi:hypothetical protein